MTTVYIAGPMSGYENFNYDAFYEAEGIILDLAQGWGLDLEVVNPARNFDGDQSLPWETYLDKAAEQVAESDVMVLLPGWRESEGVQRELTVARENNVRVVGFWEYTGKPGPTGKPAPEVHALKPGCCDEHEVPLEHPDLASQLASVDDELAAKEKWEAIVAELDALKPAPEIRIIDEAWALVMGDRQATYGHPSSDFAAMGKITAGILGRVFERLGLKLVPREPGDPPTDVPAIPPADVALIQVAVKLSREAGQHKHDNLVDTIGYAICKDRIEEGY